MNSGEQKIKALQDALENAEATYKRKQKKGWMESFNTVEQYPAWMLKTELFTERKKLNKRRNLWLGSDIYEHIPQRIELRAVGYCKEQWNEDGKTKLRIEDTSGGITVSMKQTDALVEGHIFILKLISNFARFEEEIEIGEWERYTLAITDTGYTMTPDKIPEEENKVLQNILQLVAQYDKQYDMATAVEIINSIQNYVRLNGISVKRMFGECIEFSVDSYLCRVLWDGIRINISISE